VNKQYTKKYVTKKHDDENVVNTMKVKGNGYQSKRAKGEVVNKFVDTLVNTNVSSSGVAFPITAIAQNVTVSGRTGDTVFIKELYLNYAITVDFSDIHNVVRVMIAQFHPSSALVVPVILDFFQTLDPLSMYNWQLSSNYTILYDKVHYLSGVSAAPCTSSLQGYSGIVGLNSAQKRLEFTAALITGSEQLFVIVLSDSGIPPGPGFSMRTRLVYCED